MITLYKARIFATCEANGLDYVHDPTNFQPELTLRNALRTVIAKVDVILFHKLAHD